MTEGGPGPDDLQDTTCAAGDGPITLRDGESMSASSGPGGEVLFWHRHCYDLAHVPPAREVRPEPTTKPDFVEFSSFTHQFPAFEEWLTKWFEANLTIDTFKMLADDEMAAKLAADMKAANWVVFKVTRVPFDGFFKIGEVTEHG